MQLLFSLFSSFYVKRGSMLSFPKTSCPFLPIFCYLCYFFYLLLSFTTFSIFCCFSIFLCLFLSFLSSSIFQPSQPLLHPSSAVFPVCLREFHPAAVRLLLFSRDIPDPFCAGYGAHNIHPVQLFAGSAAHPVHGSVPIR